LLKDPIAVAEEIFDVRAVFSPQPSPPPDYRRRGTGRSITHFYFINRYLQFRNNVITIHAGWVGILVPQLKWKSRIENLLIADL
jgi:hypothetical protein